MNNGKPAHESAQSAADICRRVALGAAAEQLLRDGQSSGEFLDLLVENQRYPEAARFLAHALPKREAVGWACWCVRQVAGDCPPAPWAEALGAAEQWAADPSEANRRAALPAAQAAGMGTAAGCVAAAAFWSGGSLGPPTVPPIPPAEDLTAKAVAGAVMLAAVITEPQHAPQRWRRFLVQGVEVARSTGNWN